MKKSNKALAFVFVAIMCGIANIFIFANVAIVGTVADITNTAVPHETMRMIVPYFATMFVGTVAFCKYDKLKEEIRVANAARKNKRVK